ncbi:hypothetical protein DFO50_1262 [Microvirgula sp. AG722]|nr:hypothetical protein DFO50_1262 [Microvirgula sp. AG722]
MQALADAVAKHRTRTGCSDGGQVEVTDAQYA